LFGVPLIAHHRQALRAQAFEERIIIVFPRDDRRLLMPPQAH
jgi:hypothetical protein